jgi:hypothetical protein
MQRDFFSLVLLVVFLYLVVFAQSFFIAPSAYPAYTVTVATSTYEMSVEIPALSNGALAAALKQQAQADAADFDSQFNPSSFSPEDFALLGFGDGRTYDFTVTATPWSYAGIDGATLEEYSFTGGAHGGTTLSTFAYHGAARLALSDLFVPGAPYLSRASRYAQTVFRQKLIDAGIFFEDMFAPGVTPTEENFAVFSLGKDGITFIFQQYQVAPYVAGNQTMTIPYAELSDILSPVFFK